MCATVEGRCLEYLVCITLVTPIAIEKIKILGTVLELPAKQHCQFSPFGSFLQSDFYSKKTLYIQEQQRLAISWQYN